MLGGFTSHTGAVTTIARLNVRNGKPGTDAPVAMKVEPGVQLRVFGVGSGEEVKGNNTWFAGDDNTYFWSGGCAGFMAEQTAAPGAQAATLSVNRRPNGTIRPLNEQQMRQVFGSFKYEEMNGGRIRIAKAWTDANIVELKSPLLAAEGYPSIIVHRKAARAFESVFEAIELAGLASRILTCAGTFVPRHKGWDRTRELSSHSWGVAIDLNVAWNGYGSTPAPLGAQGSLRELVPFFEAQGFAWGGYFSAPYQDGMHFELARLDL